MKQIVRRMLNLAADRFASQTANRIFRQPILDDIQGTKSLATFDVRKFAQIVAGLEAGEFYCRHLYNAAFFANYVDHVAEMARRASLLGNGSILEFGVASGTTLNAIANAVNKPVVGFDSFKGLPADWRDGVKAGAFACEPPPVPHHSTLKVGLIEDTLPAFLAEQQDTKINFIHIDTDLYEPAKLILEQCAPHIDDAIIVFDEFFNFPGWRDHEYKAFLEFQTNNVNTFNIRFVGLGGQAAVSIHIKRT